MRKFGNGYNQHLGAHGVPQQQPYQQGYGQPYQQGYGQPQQGVDIGTVLGKLNQAVGINSNNIDTLNQRLTAVENALKMGQHQQVHSNSKDYRAPNTHQSATDEMLSYGGRRYGNSMPEFEPKKVEVEEEPVKEEQDMSNDLVNQLEVKLSKGTNPFNDKSIDFNKFEFSKDISIKRLNTIVCTGGITAIDESDLFEGGETNVSFGANAIVTNDYVKVSKDFITRELMVPGETVHGVLRRLTRECTNQSELIFLNGLDELLTHKLREYLELHVSKIDIPSYANDYEDLCFLMRERAGSEKYKELVDGFSVIVEDTVRRTFQAYFEFIGEEEDVDVPLLDQVTLVKVNTLSTFLGLNVSSIKYDEFVQVIVNDNNKELFELVATACDKLNPGRRTYHLITKDDKAYKLVHTNDNKLFIKRFVSNF